MTAASFRTLIEIGAPPVLDEPRRRGTALDGDAAFGIDANGQQTAWVQDLLDFLDRAHIVAQARRGLEPVALCRRERFAEIVHRLHEASHLR